MKVLVHEVLLTLAEHDSDIKINKNKKFRSFKSKENIYKKGRSWAYSRFQL